MVDLCDYNRRTTVESDTLTLRRHWDLEDSASVAAQDHGPVLSPADEEANRIAALHGLGLPVCPVHGKPPCGCYGDYCPFNAQTQMQMQTQTLVCSAELIGFLYFFSRELPSVVVAPLHGVFQCS